MYAVLDIEATGGKKGEEDIIEVAIYRFDGKKITDQMISLVCPERQIDPFVQKLTQITPKMVRTAPKFHELAKRIIEITEGAILVGHNVEFDYRMLKQEFRKLGYSYYRETIDTVPLSEKYFPDVESYSLGKLSKSLGIPVSGRHRAAGDARATIEIFKLLLDKDSAKNIAKFVVEPKKSAGRFSEHYQELPNCEGLFYILNAENEVIYLSRTPNLALSVRKLLTGKTALSNQVRMNFERVKHEITGNDLLSRIKEYHEIKKLQPRFNSPNQDFPYCLSLSKKNGYSILRIERLKKSIREIVFGISNFRSAREILSLITEDYNLCPKMNGLTSEDGKCLSYSVGECGGACEGVEDQEVYNQRVQDFLDKIKLEDRNFLLKGLGRKRGEHSFIWVKNGVLMGYGFYEFHHQIKTEKLLRERMTQVESDFNTLSLIQRFLFSERYEELIDLS